MKYEAYLELLLKWNDKYNLTSITDSEKIRTHHFEDSLSPLPFLKNRNTLIDLGTGAGFPGIPLKIEMPELRVTLVDAKRKKIAFCSEVIRNLSLVGIDAVQGRAEDPYLYRMLGLYDVVISRATWPLSVFLEIADAYYDEGGVCIAMRGSNYKKELTDSEEVIERHKLKLIQEHPYSIGDDEKRCLLIFQRRSI